MMEEKSTVAIIELTERSDDETTAKLQPHWPVPVQQVESLDSSYASGASGFSSGIGPHAGTGNSVRKPKPQSMDEHIPLAYNNAERLKANVGWCAASTCAILGCCGLLGFSYVTVPENHTALVIEFRRWKRNLKPGVHFVSATEEVQIMRDVFIEEDHFGILTRYNRYIETLEPGQYSVNTFLGEKITDKKLEIIEENHMGVLVRDGVFIRLLHPGKHAVNDFLNEKLIVKAMTVIQELHRGLLLRDGKFIKVLPPGKWFANDFVKEVIHVRPITIVHERERGIFTVNGVFKKMLPPGEYFQNEVLNEKIAIKPTTIVEEGHVGILLVDGQYKALLKPGEFFENQAKNEKIITCSMQIQTKELKPVLLVTKDTVTITIYSILIYCITDAVKAVCHVENLDFAIRESIKSITHQVLSEHDLDYIMSNKITLSNEIKERVKANCLDWGLAIQRVDIKDVVFDDMLKESMMASAKAKRTAEAKIITAQAEIEIGERLRKVADLTDTNSARHLRNLEALVKLSEKAQIRMIMFPDSLMGMNKGDPEFRQLTSQMLARTLPTEITAD